MSFSRSINFICYSLLLLMSLVVFINRYNYYSAPVVTNPALNFQTKDINPVLKQLHLYSTSASNLLLGTAIQESLLGRLSHNIFQIDPGTTPDVIKNYLNYRPKLKAAVFRFYNAEHSLHWNLNNNIKFEIAIARIVYLRSNELLPTASNVQAMGRFWKTNYNTYLGKGTPNEFITHYAQFVYTKPVQPANPLASPFGDMLTLLEV